jgi:carbon monoxide dehydrogenase subunit G
MKMEQSFEVNAHIDDVWKALIDIERVAPCLPGADITEQTEDGSYKGTFTVKLGPTTASYNGVLKIAETDPDAYRAVLNARGTDRRGQGGATATIVNTLTERDGRTHVHADTDFAITGRLARFGRAGMIEDISNRLLRDFANCLQAQLEREHQVEAAAATAASAAAGTAPEDSGAGNGAATVPPRPPEPYPHQLPPHEPAKPINAFYLVVSITYGKLAELFNRPGRFFK